MRRVGGDPQLSTMGFDDRPADRKSHAKTVGFGREEGVEDALRDGRVEPRAGILDRNLQTIRRGEGDGHGQLPPAVADRCHGLDAVHDQVQQHLLQLDPVAQHRLRAGGQIRVQHDAVPLQFAAGENQHLLNGVADVEAGQLQSGFLGQRPQTADHVARRGAVALDARERGCAHRRDRGDPGSTSARRSWH